MCEANRVSAAAPVMNSSQPSVRKPEMPIVRWTAAFRRGQAELPIVFTEIGQIAYVSVLTTKYHGSGSKLYVRKPCDAITVRHAAGSNQFEVTARNAGTCFIRPSGGGGAIGALSRVVVPAVLPPPISPITNKLGAPVGRWTADFAPGLQELPLRFTAVGQTALLTVYAPRYYGTGPVVYTEPSPCPVATFERQQASNLFKVTALASGVCTLRVSDGGGPNGVLSEVVIP